MKQRLCAGLLCGAALLAAPPVMAGHAHYISSGQLATTAAADEANPNAPKKTNAAMNANVHAGSSNASVTGGAHSSPKPGGGGGGGEPGGSAPPPKN